MAQLPRILVVSFTIHGFVNPAIRLAERLVSAGAEVTFVTAVSSQRRIVEPRYAGTGPPSGLSFAPFSDNHDEGFKYRPGPEADHFDAEQRRLGSKALSELITKASSENRPYSCVIYTAVITWVAQTAEELNTPAVLLWVQAATSFVVDHAYFHGHKDLIDECFRNKDTDKCLTELSHLGLPLDLCVKDLPNFMDASSPQVHFAKYFSEVFELFGSGERTVLVNTFDDLEPEGIRSLNSKGIRLIGIGPLIDVSPPRNTPISDGYAEWLSSREKGSVVYVAFGTISELAEKQTEQVAEALLEFGKPFLWVVRGEKTRRREELERLGLMVPWCDQVAVLRSGALSCFVSHCGWNSTFESLTFGVPIVGVPQRIDQFTNARLIQDYWKVGVRAASTGDSGLVERKELKRCLDLVVGDEELRSNSDKWKGLAAEALAKDGSSERNLKRFLNGLAGDDLCV